MHPGGGSARRAPARLIRFRSYRSVLCPFRTFNALNQIERYHANRPHALRDRHKIDLMHDAATLALPRQHRIGQVAKTIGVDRRTLISAAQRGELRVTTVGRRLFVTEDAVAAYLSPKRLGGSP